MLGRPFVLLLEPGKYTGLNFYDERKRLFRQSRGNYLEEESG
jgi:hypothetical protein